MWSVYYYQGRVHVVLVFCLDTLWSGSWTEWPRWFSKTRQAGLQFVPMHCLVEHSVVNIVCLHFGLNTPSLGPVSVNTILPLVSQALMLQWVLVNLTSCCIFFSFCSEVMLLLFTLVFNLDCISIQAFYVSLNPIFPILHSIHLLPNLLPSFTLTQGCFPHTSKLHIPFPIIASQRVLRAI